MSPADPASGPALRSRALAWADEDPDPATAAELREVVATADDGDAEAAADLADRFAGTLQFGTAGLRGALGAGPNRMNRVVVIRAAAGLAGWLRAQDRGGGVVVVGYDARHRSDDFARDTAAVMTAAGFDVLLLPRPLPTPVLAFAVRRTGAVAGVMVTASHNPPQDNGYKVYLGGPGEEGAQIVPPADAGIAAAIDAVGPVSQVPRAEQGWRVAGDDLLQAYLDRAAATARPGGPRELSLVLTPLHGVGGDVVAEALRRSGFTDTWTVPEQAAPDPAFPTLAFPNPEEPGAMDLALAAARRRGADLVVANDPDADRCAVAVPDPAADGGWRMLHGDEVGALLGEHLARRGLPRAADGPAVLACSVVSGSLLARVAAAHGLRSARTLTGFKWISRVPGLGYGYEEALGYCVDPQAVRDKDGVSAAVLVAEAAAVAKAGGGTLLDLLDELALAHGVHLSDQVSVRVRDLAVITAVMRRLRAEPPDVLGGSPVTGREDLSGGSADLPATDALVLHTADGDRVVVRPSGTEPKLKAYLEVVVPVTAPDAADGDDDGDDDGDGEGDDDGDGDDGDGDGAGQDSGALTAARRDAAARMQRLRRDVRTVVGAE